MAARDRSEKANIALYNACTHDPALGIRLHVVNQLLTPISILDTQLADRTSRLTTSSIPVESQRTVSSSQASLGKKQPPGEPGQSLQETLAATRADLSDAQRSRSELQNKLNHVSTDLEKLRKKSTQDARRISTLESQRTQLQLRLKDRDEELRGKAKLLDVWSPMRRISKMS